VDVEQRRMQKRSLATEHSAAPTALSHAGQRRAGKSLVGYGLGSGSAAESSVLPKRGANRDSKPLPHNGTWYFSNLRKYRETIIFVPFFGGTKLQLQRHIQFVNALGFDAVAFEFSYDDRFLFKRPPLSTRAGKLGLKHQWADEVEDILNSVLGAKIIYAFSNPSSSAIEALVRRPQRYGKTQNCRDVRALICDSGPFVHLLSCSFRLMKYDRHVLLPIRLPAAALSALLWAPDHEASLHRDLSELPPKFPILSIRGWKDKLVPIKAIEDAFVGHDQLQLEVLGLPEAGHLEGLKAFPEEYKPRVERFLERWATLNPTDAPPGTEK
jgi:pimeloyl-ACP methyl ester carboxylesterase